MNRNEQHQTASNARAYQSLPLIVSRSCLFLHFFVSRRQTGCSINRLFEWSSLNVALFASAQGIPVSFRWLEFDGRPFGNLDSAIDRLVVL